MGKKTKNLLSYCLTSGGMGRQEQGEILRKEKDRQTDGYTDGQTDRGREREERGQSNTYLKATFPLD